MFDGFPFLDFFVWYNKSIKKTKPLNNYNIRKLSLYIVYSLTPKVELIKELKKIGLSLKVGERNINCVTIRPR